MAKQFLIMKLHKYKNIKLLILFLNIFNFFCQLAAKIIKETLDKKYGASWQCIIGN